jgi:hypothetical protein
MIEVAFLTLDVSVDARQAHPVRRRPAAVTVIEIRSSGLADR